MVKSVQVDRGECDMRIEMGYGIQVFKEQSLEGGCGRGEEKGTIRAGWVGIVLV